MKNKRFLIIILAILMIFSTLSVVSASDGADNQTATLGVDNQNPEEVSAAPIEDTLSDDSPGTFTDLNGIINNPSLQDGDEILLDKDYIYNNDTDQDLMDGIVFRTGLVIDGQGHTIDANNMARIFSIGSYKDASGKITHLGTTSPFIIKNVIFKNAYSTKGDHQYAFGAVEVTGSGVFENCQFINNTAPCAAAIAWGYGDMSVEGCYFENNTATSMGGGAIRAKSNINHATIIDSTFVDNHALSDGGAIHFGGNSMNSDNTIINSTFIGNTAGNHAGAVFYGSPNGVTRNSRFINNTAGYGGAIMISGTNWFVYDSNFTGNVATSNHGGAIYLEESTGSDVVGCIFTNNTASKNGGAIDWHEGAVNGKVVNSTFNNNIANRSGGAIYWNGVNGTISGSNFTGNNATATIVDDIGGGDGGAILWIGHNGTVDDCIFVNNFAPYRGGAVFLKNSTNATFSNSYFRGNIAGMNGGAIDWQSGSHDGKLVNSTFIDNTAWRSGGAVYWYGTNGTIITCNFTNNIAIGNVSSDKRNIANYTTVGGNGGAIIWTGSIGLVDNCNFIGNNASRLGGAVYLQQNTNITFQNSHFTNNSAGINGGAIDFNRGAINGTIINSTFDNNIANRSAGAVFWFGTNGAIKNSNFTNNRALGIANYTDSYGNNNYGGNGGAIVWTGSQGTVTNCLFENNNATKNGGAVYIQGSDLGNSYYSTFDHCTFTSNVAGMNGGAVDWHEGAEYGNVWNSTFTLNIANSNGGAVFWNGHNGVILDSNFTNNKALGTIMDSHKNIGDGGAVIWSGLNGTVDNCVFESNEAAKRGGAVFLQNCTHGNCDNTTFSNSKFINNVAGTNGGAIDWFAGAEHGRVENISFINNTAKRSGGAIYWNGFNGTIANSNFTGNKALGINNATDAFGEVTYGGDGGAVIWIGSQGTVDNCIFENNTAVKRGGAVYLQGSSDGDSYDTRFINSDFVGNVAGTNGGAIDWNDGAHNGLIENVTFVGNVANRSGGAVYWNGHNGTIKDSNFTNNKALGQALGPMPNGTLTNGGDGGAIIWTGALGEIKNSRFINNTAPYRGGAVYLQGGSEDCDNTTFKDSYFENNHAGLNGGAIDWSKGAHNGTIDNCTFIKNVADRSAGAVYWSGTQGVIANSTFKYNTVIGNVSQDDRGITTYSTAGGNGGAVVWMGSVGLIYNSTFDENTAPQRGGAIYLQNNENTTVEKSNFTKNIAGLNGGAVDWYKGAINGAIIDSRFDSNIANRSGGAVYWYGHNGTINGSTFIHNEAKGIAEGTTPSGEITTGGDGGAIIWTGALGYVDNCTFTDNKALQRGGAVYLQSGSDEACDNTTFAYCNFTNNYAGLNGGAVDWFEGATNGYIINSTFDNNIAESNGGAVFWNGHYGTIQNSNFTNNKAKGTKEDSHGNVGDGGAIIWSGIGGFVENCIFEDNEAPQRGGAVFLQNCTHGDCDNTTFFNCTFESNHAGLNGGAIDWHEGATNGRIINSTFYNNTAKHSGGAVFWNGDTGYIINSTFDYNLAIGPEGSESSYDSDGGAVKWTGSNGLVENTIFINNHAYKGRGGAVYLEDNTNGTFFNCYFENNTAGLNGGAVDWHEGAINGNISHSIFVNNAANKNGGAVYWYGLNGTMDNVTFINNNATAKGYESDPDATRGMGGAIYWYGDNGVMNRINASNNYAYEDGGVLFINGNNVKMYNSTFTDNTAGDDGGAIFWTGSVGLIYNSTFDNSQGISANGNSKGGAICLTGSNINITKSNFTNSYAKKTGGALFITGNYTIISDSIFNDSRVDKTSEGGAICVLGNHTTIRGSSFDNSSANLGGSIYISGNNATIIGSNFTNSYAYEDGGAIYIAGFLTQIYNSTFINGTAADDGGAVYWQGNNGTLDGCVFVNNKGISSYEVGSTTRKHTSKGGTISIIGDNTKISNSNFTDSFTENNRGENVGGTIFITGHDVDLVGCNFNNSEARSSDGGTIYIIGYNVRVINSTIDNSTARKGGAIYIDGVNASVINSTLNNTSAKTETSYTTNNLGGAVYIKGNNANIICSEIENASAYQGGALYLEGNYCNVTNSSVKGGYAYIDGGALYSTGSYSNVYYSNFTSNEARGDGGAMYWFGGRNSIHNTIVGCIFLENAAYANSNSNTKGGGAIYWSEGGYYGTIKDSQFINNSVQSTVKADGGAILWDKCHYALIDNCIFDGDYVTTTNTGDVWVQGGAIYLRAEDPYTITNSKFINCYSGKEAGALYIQSNSDRHIILIANTTFINNVAKSIGLTSNGGGAVQVKQSDITIFQNVTFINNTANQGGAVTVLETKSNITFINCTFDNNTATNGNGGSIWANKKFFMYNTTIANSTASNYGGGLYASSDMYYDNLTFINNTATSGGALYWNKANVIIQNMKFINNTAINRGGAIYITSSGATIQNVNMTGNKAFTGSAIWADKDVTLVDVYLMKNQANSSSINIDFDESNGNIVVLFKGKDKYLNAIYLNGGCRLYCTNVTYWDESGETNTGSSRITWPTTTAQDTPEGGQNLTIRVNGAEGLLVEKHILTDNDGKVYLNLADIISNTNYYEMYVESELNDDTYYTIIKSTTRSASQISASANKTTYHSNSTLNVNVTMGATGNVSVYIGDTFIANITLEASKGSINMSTLVEGVYLPVGNHTLSFVYNGNVKYDKSNTTAILEINKITPVMLLNVTGIGYNLLINVTVMDGEYNITDATGNVTIQVEDRTATIYLGNGQGMTIIYGLPIGNYTVNATYHGDNNYYNIANSADANVSEKTHTVLVLDVDSEKLYYINETVPIKVTILPAGEGNVTLYINGVPHELTLQTVGNSTFVEFNATELKEGINYVFATYGGAERYAHSWAQDTFHVIKYNSTIGIETANIPFKGTEIINITLPDDVEGIIKVLINDTPYFVEVVGGSAQVNVSDLAVGTYNVTVIFNGDNKYYNSTNSTLFNVTKIRPDIKIDVYNVTYGNETVIVVILPDGVTGNVTIKVNDTIIVYEEQEIVDGKVTLPGTIFAAGNYTVEATYNGDGNYSVSTAQTKFTVYRATPVINVSVDDIYYGKNANITVTVPDGVSGTIIIKVNGTESEPLTITEGKVNLTVSGLASGNYPVEVIYSGNNNYSDAIVTTDFEVFQIGTELDIDVHDISVWDKEYINITIRNADGDVITNATGNVTININGANYTAEIKDGIVRFNTSDLTVGHKVVWVFYDGDINLTGNRSMAEFDVNKRVPVVKVTAQNITVGVTENITINIPANATGFIIINVNGQDYAKKVTNGEVTLALDDLTEGIYPVTVTYLPSGNENYTENTNETIFQVSKNNSTIEIEVKNVTYDGKVNITVKVPNEVTGNLTIRINNTDYGPFLIIDGKVNIIVPGLAADVYNITATYNGNVKYNRNSTSKLFEVYRATPTITIEIGDIEIDKTTTVTFTVNSTATGNLTGRIGDKEFNEKIVDGKVTVVSDVLANQTYVVEVHYVGDRNYTTQDNNTSFSVPKTSDYELNVSAGDIKVGDLTNIIVTVPDDASGIVVINIDGANYTAVINGGKAVFENQTDLGEGRYNVTAYFGDAKYANKTATGSFHISKVETPITIKVDSIYVGDKAIVEVTVPADVSGNVTIEINGRKYNKTVGTDGIVVFEVLNLTAGNKTVIATYDGDKKYMFNATTANFTVSKRISQLNVTATGGNVGENATITVKVQSNATGYVVVNVNGTNYSINLTDGEGSIEIENLKNGTYTVKATYIGDDQYLTSENSTKFSINKIESHVSVKVENITVGDVESVNITVTTGATGNVTIKIGDEFETTVGVIDGVISVIVPGLTVGDKVVNVTYNGNDKYLPSNTSVEFKVKRINTTDANIKVIDQGNGTVVVMVPENATGNVTIKVNGTNFTGNITNGTAIIDLTNVTPGEHNITVVYSGDENYTNATVNSTVVIPKLKTPISVNVTGIYVGDKALINVTLPVNATGAVVIEIDGKSYNTTDIVDGIARFSIENLTYGNKTVCVTYSGDENYVENHTSANFLVNKRTPDIKIEVDPINVGETANIEITLPNNATGYVVVEIENQTYAVKVDNGKGIINVKGLSSGEIQFNVTYLGDDQYFENNDTSSVKVSKVPSTINVTAENIVVGDKEIITISVPKDICGNVTVTVDNKNYTVPVSGGKGILVISNLTVGNYTVDAVFDGCKKYEASSGSDTFNVSKINNTDVKVVDQGNGTVVVVVGDNATGNVTVVLENGTNFTAPVVNGTAVVNLTNVTPGSQNITVIYSGDENHTNVTVDANVTIPKMITPIDVNVSGIFVGDKALINVTVPGKATGNVAIEIDGKKYSAVINEGVARFIVENLTAGVKTVAVTYGGDNNYVSNFTTANFTVSKRASFVNVSDAEITVGDDAVINVTVPANATGFVLVTVNNKTYAVNVTDGKGSIVLDTLSEDGTYDVNVTYLGDDQYLSSNNTASVKVSKVPSFVNVTVGNITVGDNAIIELVVPVDATGNVTVNVGGKNYNVSVAGGKGILVVPGLGVGEYTVDVKYLGDNKYDSNTNSAKFTVAKINDTDVKVVDQGNGTVVVVVGDNATGNVTVVLENGTNFTAPVVNGTAVVNLTNVTPGSQNITVIYSGDENHTNVTVNGTVSIPKHKTPISISVEDIDVGDIAEIFVTVPGNASGNITLEIDGRKYTGEIKNGKAIFKVDNLTAGNKTVSAYYGGNDEFEGNFTTSTFKVSKIQSDVSAEIKSVNVGEDVEITVTVPKDATGQVLVDIGDKHYYVNVTDGTGVLKVPYLPEGNYTVDLTYLGDGKYLPSSGKSNFSVSKLPSFVIPKAQNIFVGDNEVITLEVPEDATGNVTVVIDGEEYVFNLNDGILGSSEPDRKHDVAVSGGKGILTVSGLPKGEYVVSVRYNGDSKYLPSENTTSFIVSKQNHSMDVIDEGNGTVIIELPDNATGNVTVVLENGTNFTVPVVNGTAVVNLTNVTPGNHNITVIYSGDDYYVNQTVNSTIHIPKYDTPISVSVSDIKVGQTAVVTVTVPNKATGTITIEINGKEYSAAVKDGKAVFNVKGLESGDKTVAVKYSGDDSYVENFTTTQFKVSKNPSTVKATSNNIKVGNDEIITVTVPKDATGRVLVDINGVGYYATIVNGKARVVVPELSSGTYTAKVTYDGDGKYLPGTTTTKFTVTKNSAPIKATGDEIKQGENATVIVKVPDDATGTVVITVDGKTYVADVDNGRAIFNVPGLNKGDHDIDAVYSGDRKYESNSTITDIEVIYSNNAVDNHSDSNKTHSVNALDESPAEGISLYNYPTGNPIIVLLLVLVMLGSMGIRKSD